MPGERKQNVTDNIKLTKLLDSVLPESSESLNDIVAFISKTNYN